MLKQLTLALLIVGMTASVADARNNRRAADNRAAVPACMQGGVAIDCITGEPIVIDRREVEQPRVTETASRRQRRDRHNDNTIIVGVTRERDTILSPVPPDLPLNTAEYTIERFNDSRVATIHNLVGVLINEAVSNTPRSGRNGRRLVDELQIRLDRVADGGNRNRQVDRYWISRYPDRAIVYVKPMRSVHVITYTILYE